MFTSTLVALTNTSIYSYIHIYILKVCLISYLICQQIKTRILNLALPKCMQMSSYLTRQYLICIFNVTFQETCRNVVMNELGDGTVYVLFDRIHLLRSKSNPLELRNSAARL